MASHQPRNLSRGRIGIWVRISDAKPFQFSAQKNPIKARSRVAGRKLHGQNASLPLGQLTNGARAKSLSEFDRFVYCFLGDEFKAFVAHLQYFSAAKGYIFWYKAF
jgi:hypothetical protein